jgi:hypothetical protein
MDQQTKSLIETLCSRLENEKTKMHKRTKTYATVINGLTALVFFIKPKSVFVCIFVAVGFPFVGDGGDAMTRQTLNG